MQERMFWNSTQELLRQGYIAFIEFRNPLAKESLQPDLDYVLCSHGHTLTPEQEEWLEHNQDMISRRQQYDINKDDSYTFKGLLLSDVVMYERCGQCPATGGAPEMVQRRADRTAGIVRNMSLFEIPE